MMNVLELMVMLLITYIGIKYVFDMIRFACGEEVNGKKREPIFLLKGLLSLIGERPLTLSMGSVNHKHSHAGSMTSSGFVRHSVAVNSTDVWMNL